MNLARYAVPAIGGLAALALFALGTPARGPVPRIEPEPPPPRPPPPALPPPIQSAPTTPPPPAIPDLPAPIAARALEILTAARSDPRSVRPGDLTLFAAILDEESPGSALAAALRAEEARVVAAAASV